MKVLEFLTQFDKFQRHMWKTDYVLFKQTFIGMSSMMKSIIMFLLNINLSVAEFFFTAQSNASQVKILQTFKGVLMTECLIKCKQTPNCKDISIVEGKDKKIVDCYLLANDNNYNDEERFSNTRSFTVNTFTLY